MNSESLLQHGDFLRALARRLLSDTHDVEDAVQDTYVAALKNDPDRPDRTKSWLRSLMFNWARNRARDRGRRTARELATAAPEAIDTAWLTERDRVLRSLVDAVAELPDGDRAVVMLRYFDGLPPRDIARQLELPVETVRTRNKRALAKLRGRLDDSFDGRRRRWAVALAPIAGLKRSAATTLALSPLPRLSLTVRGAYAVAALLLLSTAVLPWFTPLNMEATNDPAAPRTPTASPTAATRTAMLVPASPTRELASGDDPAERARWEVRAEVQAHRAFTPGAQLEVWTVQGAVRTWIGSGIADDNGLCVIPVDEALRALSSAQRATTTLRIRAEAPGHLTTTRDLSLSGKKPQSLWCQLTLTPGAALRGRVLAASGRPARSVSIAQHLANGESKRHDFELLDGRFEIPVEVPGSSEIELWNIEHGVAKLGSLSLRTTTDTVVPDVTLSGQASISGTVLDNTGTPIVGLLLYASKNAASSDGQIYSDQGLRSAQCQTDGSGRFRFQGLTSGTFEIAPSDGTLAEPLIVAAGREDVVIRMDSYRLQITAVDEYGRSVPGCTISGSGNDGSTFQSWVIGASSTLVEWVRPSTIQTVRATAPGFASDPVRISIPDRQGSSSVTVTLRAYERGDLQVRLDSPDGTPYPWLLVSLYNHATGEGLGDFMYETPDDQGMLLGVPCGRIRVVIDPGTGPRGEKDSFLSREVIVNIEPDVVTEAHLTSTKGAYVRFFIDGLPSDFPLLTLMHGKVVFVGAREERSLEGALTLFGDPEAERVEVRYDLSLPPGDCTFRFLIPDRRTVEASTTLLAGQTTDVEIDLPRP